VLEREIFSAVVAAVQYIRTSGKKSCHLLLCDDAKTEFAEFDQDADIPDYVVVGDLGDDISFKQLNIAFQKLFAGSMLLGLQKNRYWISDEGATLDAGAFVALLEFAAQKEAVIVGKPQLDFFRLALEDIGISSDRVYMVGDDIESDIIGSSHAGIKGILVKSGKYNDTISLPKDLHIAHIMNSVADLPNIINQLI
jgi:HAD superfamily hydrolase (TIGR01458 family)